MYLIIIQKVTKVLLNIFCTTDMQGPSRRGFRGRKAPADFWKALIGAQVKWLKNQEIKQVW